jgi:ABC-2 type transport system permease protein
MPEYMSLRRTLAIVLRQIYLIRGSFPRIFPLFAWVAVDMVLWGFLTKYLNSVTASGFNFVPVLLGAVLLWDFFIRIMQGVTMAFFEDVWSRNFLNIFATPLLISEYVAGLVLSSILTSMAGLAVMLVIAVMVFKLSFLVYGLMVIPFLLVLFLFGIAIGIFGCALVLRFGPASEWFIWPIPALISPFVGVLYPVSTLPEWMQIVSRLLPPSYVFEELRVIVSGGVASWTALAWSACLAVIYILAAYWFFARIYRHSLRTGIIARYSAENLG